MAVSGYGGAYTSKANIVTFAKTLKTDLIEANISDDMLNATTLIINQRTDTYWAVYSGALYVDGRGEDFVFSPVVPIATLTEVAIIDRDTTEETLTLTGTDRQVWWNNETGLIKRIDKYGIEDIRRDPDPGALFPEGVKNIKITGTFGEAKSAALLAILQTMLVIQMLKYRYPSDFQTDLVMERIGEYEYRIGDQQYSKDPRWAKKTLEGYIEYLFDCLPHEDKLYVLAV